MTRIQRELASPFDLLFANLFEDGGLFKTLENCTIPYPVNVYEVDEMLHIEIAAVGIDEDDLSIEVDNERTLRVSYNKGEETDPRTREWHHRGLTRKSFNLGWKITGKWDTSKIDANLDKGLLLISMPLLEESKPKTIKINKK